MQKKSASINLVKSKVDYFEEFIKWALSIGRLVVILTEIIALITFVYRFSLDRQLIDLHTKIVQEKTIVSLLKDQEDIYRNLQSRLALASTSSKNSEQKVKIFTDIQKNKPEGVTFNNLSVFEQGIRINAAFNSVSALSNFVNFLKSYSLISSVSIDRIENRSASASIVVGITALFKVTK